MASSSAPAPAILPFGSWPTPVTSELVVRAAAAPTTVQVDGDDVWWGERRPEEGGRTQIVRRASDGMTSEVLPEGWNARTAAHEYGGGAWWVRAGTLWFASWADQRLYRLDPGGQPIAITAQPPVARGDRWADGDVSPDGRSIVCVRERHQPGGGPADVVNQVVRLDADPAALTEPHVLVSGPDFVSDPRWRPDGAAISWLEWDHPNMPWDGTRLMVREGDGSPVLLAGGEDESIAQPRWHADGSLWFISDRTGWWNLYRWTPAAGIEPMVVMEAEIGEPQWVFGGSRYDFLSGDRVVFAYSRDGFDHLAVSHADGAVDELPVGDTSIESVVARGSSAVWVGASPDREPAVVTVDVDPGGASAPIELLSSPRDLGLPHGLISVPEPIEFPTGGGATAFGLFYPPSNPLFAGPAGEHPPLLVMIHGGPTSAAIPALRLSVQYWTSRGFAVVDVNYRGSTGFGRSYRNLLRDAWGVADVEDCRAAARWLAEHGRVDPARLCIRGGSAGGFTTLAALAAGDPFAAGASHYGVADLEALALETHKFESRYLDGLIGPYPERRDRYVERSPIHQLDGFDRPLIVLQGLEDEVVPPAQSEMIVAALRARHVPVAYVAFEGEQHGFRQAVNIRRALDAELSFYGQILGFELPPEEGIVPVDIDRARP